jgi:hypothetical protein
MKEKPKLAKMSSADFLKFVEDAEPEELMELLPEETRESRHSSMPGALVALLTVPAGNRGFREILRWWEKRRGLYNAIIGCALLLGFGWFAVIHSWLFFTLSLISVPLTLIGANLGYSLGWIGEYLLGRLFGIKSTRLGPMLFLAGTSVSIIWILYAAWSLPSLSPFGNG